MPSANTYGGRDDWDDYDNRNTMRGDSHVRVVGPSPKEASEAAKKPRRMLEDLQDQRDVAAAPLGKTGQTKGAVLDTRRIVRAGGT